MILGRFPKGQKVATDFAIPQPLTKHGPARIISMVNQKGGVGKTTATWCLGETVSKIPSKKSLLFDTHFDISTIQNILIFDAQYCKCVEQVDEQRNNVLPVAKPLS